MISIRSDSAVPAADVTFRAATEKDSDLLADLVMGDPAQEMTRVALLLYGIDDIERARPIFRAAWRAGKNWRQSEIAVVDGHEAGLLQVGRSSTAISPALVGTILRRLGPIAALRLPGRLALQGRVSPPKPDGAFIVSELHVAPAMRGRGLGAIMLARAEERATAGGFDLVALHTLTTNPAQRLYTRAGYRIVATLTDDAFETLTGAGGNVLMIKHLG